MDRVAALLRFVDAIPAAVYEASGMVRVDPDRRIAGRAFVPVGRGHAPAVPFPRGGVMILGQDFGNERNLDDVVDAGEETDDVPTWGAIIESLGDAEIPADACWFTNYVMGVRRGRGSNCVGRSPGLRRGHLRRACARLLLLQLRVQRPCAVVVLGTYVPRALAVDFPLVLGAWGAGSFRDRDLADGAAVRNARMGDVMVPLVVSILHPSLRGPNLRHRKFAGHDGADAEGLLLGLVRDVVREHLAGRRSFR